jgi:hypothetical protein
LYDVPGWVGFGGFAPSRGQDKGSLHKLSRNHKGIMLDSNVGLVSVTHHFDSNILRSDDPVEVLREMGILFWFVFKQDFGFFHHLTI